MKEIGHAFFCHGRFTIIVKWKGGFYNQQSIDKVKIDCHIYRCNAEKIVHCICKF